MDGVLPEVLICTEVSPRNVKPNPSRELRACPEALKELSPIFNTFCFPWIYCQNVEKSDCTWKMKENTDICV